MQIRDYLESILDIISASPYVESKGISLEERPPNAAYITGILSFIFRYDNALDPKAKATATYPEHKHLPGHLLPAERPSMKDILKEIANFMEAER